MIATKKYLGALLFVGVGSVAVGQNWVDVGAGSGTPPGIFHIWNYDTSIPADSRVDQLPVLTVVDETKPLLVFNSTNMGQTVSQTTTHALVRSGGTWQLLPSSNGKVFGAIETWQGYRPSIATNGTLAMAATRGRRDALSLGSDAYASFLASGDWVGRAGSLELGGITNAQTFAEIPYGVAAGVSPDGIEHIAYSRGTSTQRGMYVKFNSGASWIGLADSDTTPIAEPSSNTTHTQPQMTFSGDFPVVVWTRKTGAVETVRSLRFNTDTQTWEGLGSGTLPDNLGEGRWPQVASLPDRNSFVVVTELPIANTMKVSEWNGTAFQDLGNPLTPWGLTKIAAFTPNVSNPPPELPATAVALDSFGRPVVAFRAEWPLASGKYQIFASYRGADGQWVALGKSDEVASVSDFDYTPSDSAQHGHYGPTVAIGIDNRPVVAWQYQNGFLPSPTILLKRFDTPVSQGQQPVAVRFAQLKGLLLGDIEGSSGFVTTLDENKDLRLDAGDLRRLASRL